MRVAVLGAGLQGACIAMDLAESGAQVDLFDRNSECITQASLHNEGKIHLGYVYANDPSLRSAAAMVDGAASFGPLLERWIGSPISHLRRSSAFNYAVHRDSILSPTEFEGHLKRTHDIVAERIHRDAYLGVSDWEPPERLSQSDLEASYASSSIQAVFRTSEVSIDPAELAAVVRDRIADDELITTIFDTEVSGVRIEGERIGVEFTNEEGDAGRRYDHVVNALWDGRLAVDATVGLEPDRPWMFRVKHFLVADCPGLKLPSTTIVLGPFGDIVNYGDERFYLSWYPSGLRGISSDLEVPARLRALPEEMAKMVREGIVDGLASVVPHLDDLPADVVAEAHLGGGVIFAWGASDIDDAGSGLHNRYAIGPRSWGRYHSVDTGKLTTAPLHARMVGDRVRAAG